ncbi:MAG: dTDP-4-dehydrorhamnose 3,5-epimerase family protein [Patescibacteria group bacterium]|nr:dTDP-4-dehydrorhamnose 3,5-epimerase family protein [Patescibacteria group bacterium]
MNLYKPSKELEIVDGVFETGINGLWYVKRRQFDDGRGFFAETGHIHKLEEVSGEEFKVKQINHSRSKKNVVRGMHAEDWKKLIFVTMGVSFSALVDVRPESKTFKKVVNFKLGFGEDALNGGLFILPGIANSVCVLKGPVDYIYLVDRLYKDRDPRGDIAISVFDKDLDIKWPLKKEEMIISDRDKQAVSLREKFEK